MRLLVLPLLTLVLAQPILAADGVMEISQTCALSAAGCFAGDTQGFPVTIEGSGSYGLTSDLAVGNQTAVQINAGAAGATLDLNGFAIRGNTVCAGTPVVCSPSGVGTGVRIVAMGVRVANGAISGMSSHGVNATGHDAQIENLRLTSNGGACIKGGQGALIRNNTMRLCGAEGIVSSAGSLVVENTVAFCGGLGVSLDPLSGSGSNVLRSNNGGAGNPQVSEGVNVAPNVCDASPCSSPPGRGFYITATDHVGSAALTACAAGYHMASLWEIVDVSNLRYDTALGATSADSGFGPPTTNALPRGLFPPGWIRTGYRAGSGQAMPGLSNCNAWTSADPNEGGSAVGLDRFWDGSFPVPTKFPWILGWNSCDLDLGVWCVQD